MPLWRSTSARKYSALEKLGWSALAVSNSLRASLYLLGFKIEAAEIEMRGGGFGIEPDGLRKFLQGAGAIEAVGQRDSQIQMRLGRIRLELDGFSEAGDRFIAAAEFGLHHAERAKSAQRHWDCPSMRREIAFRPRRVARGGPA